MTPFLVALVGAASWHSHLALPVGRFTLVLVGQRPVPAHPEVLLGAAKHLSGLFTRQMLSNAAQW